MRRTHLSWWGGKPAFIQVSKAAIHLLSGKGWEVGWRPKTTAQQFKHQSLSVTCSHDRTHSLIRCRCPPPPLFGATWHWCFLDEWAACGCDTSHSSPASLRKDPRAQWAAGFRQLRLFTGTPGMRTQMVTAEPLLFSGVYWNLASQPRVKTWEQPEQADRPNKWNAFHFSGHFNRLFN